MKVRASSLQERRRYRMVARAQSTAATKNRILDAAVAAFWSSPSTEVPLEQVADRAGVSIQTVIRHFGSKQGLFEAAVRRETAKVVEEREGPVGDTEGAIRVLVDHYEKLGDKVLRLLADEQRSPALSEVVDIGRVEHRAWCERVFASALSATRGLERERRLAQFVAICDVYTWKLLRRDADLSRRQTELALNEMVKALMEV